MNIYDQMYYQGYTPVSTQEIMAPAAVMSDREDKLDEQYGAIQDELGKTAFVAMNDPNPAVRQQYIDYMNRLNDARDELSNKGWSAVNKSKMLGLRGQYQTEIQPINVAYQTKLQDIQQYDQMRAKDPTFIGTDPRGYSVGNYLANNLVPFGVQGVSGSDLTKMASDYLKPFSQELTDNQRETLTTELIMKAGGSEEEVPSLINYIKDHGYRPGTPGYDKLLQLARVATINTTGINKWMNPDQYAQANSAIDMAGTQMIGTDQTQQIDLSKQNAQIDARNRAALAKAQKTGNIPQQLLGVVTPSPIIGDDIPVDTSNTDNIITGLRKNSGAIDSNIKMMNNLNSYTTPEQYMKEHLNTSGRSNTVLDVRTNNMQDALNPDSDKFSPALAYVKFNNDYKNLSEDQRVDELQKLYPDVDRTTLMQVAGYGVGAWSTMVMSAKVFKASTALTGLLKGGKSIGIPYLLATAVNTLYNSAQDVRDVNRQELADLLKLNTDAGYQQTNFIRQELTTQLGRQPTNNEVADVLQSDVNYRKARSGSSWTYNDASTHTQEVREALQNTGDLEGLGATIYQKKQGGTYSQVQTKKIDSKVLDKLSSPTERDYRGSTTDAQGRAGYKFTQTIGGITYTTIIPSISLQSDYSASSQIHSIIDRGVYQPTNLQTNIGQMVLVPRVVGKKIVNTVIWNGKQYTPEEIYQQEQQMVGLRYFNKGASRKEVAGQASLEGITPYSGGYDEQSNEE